MRPTAYWCHFALSDMLTRSVRVDALADVKEGFWLNDAYEFTKGDDASIWVPPSAIYQVNKWAGTNG